MSCPGATATEFSAVAGMSESRLFRLGAMAPEDVAAHAYRAMMAGKVMSLPGWRAKLGLHLLRFGTRAQARGVAARMNQIMPAASSPPPPAISGRTSSRS